MADIAERISQEWEQFKDVNQRRLDEIDKLGRASVETEQQVNAINDSITALQTELANKQQEQSGRIEELEDRLGRQQLIGSNAQIPDEKRVAYAKWESTVKGQHIDPAHVDLEFVGNYQRAFNDYMRRGAQANADSMRFLNEMSVGSDADGGYWVDPDTTGQIAQLVYETSPVRQLASATMISTDALEGTVDLGEAGSGWVGETDARPETDTPQVGRWRIDVHEQYAEPRSTQKLLDDAQVNVEAWLAGKVSDRFTRQENLAFVSGDGSHKPRGFLSYTAGAPDADNWNQIEQVDIGASASTIADASADLLIDLVYKLKSSYRAGSVFGMTRLTEAEVRKIQQDNQYIWQPDFQRRGAATLLGFPVVEMPDMPEIEADSLSIVFGNFAQAYQIVDRQGIRVLRDPYTTKGWVKFYSTKRVGGGVVNFEAIKIGKIAS